MVKTKWNAKGETTAKVRFSNQGDPEKYIPTVVTIVDDNAWQGTVQKTFQFKHLIDTGAWYTSMSTLGDHHAEERKLQRLLNRVKWPKEASSMTDSGGHSNKIWNYLNVPLVVKATDTKSGRVVEEEIIVKKMTFVKATSDNLFGLAEIRQLKRIKFASQAKD